MSSLLSHTVLMTLPPSHFLSHKEQAQALCSPLELADSATQGRVFFLF